MLHHDFGCDLSTESFPSGHSSGRGRAWYTLATFVALEILIVGDENRRTSLGMQVASFGYSISDCKPASLLHRLEDGSTPAAIVLCAAGAETSSLMAQLRRSRRGAAVPVMLCGELGGDIRDLSDVLDLGADHFLEEPVRDGPLREALEVLAGPPIEDHPVVDWHGLDEDGEPRRKSTTEMPWPAPPPMPGRDENPRATRASPRPALSPYDDESEFEDADEFLTEDAEPSMVRNGANATGSETTTAANAIPIDRSKSTPSAPATPLLTRADTEPPRELDPGFEVTLRDSVPSNATTSGSGWTTRAPERNGHTTATTGSAFAEVESGRARRITQITRNDTEPAVDRVRDVAAKPSPFAPALSVQADGSLAELEVPRLLWQLHRGGVSGRLTLTNDATQKVVTLEQGRIVDASSNVPSDDFIEALIERGLVTREAFEAVSAKVGDDPLHHPGVLAQTGLLKANEIPRLVRQHVRRVVQSTFPWKRGQWSVTAERGVGASIEQSVSMAFLLTEGVREHLDTDDLRSRLGGAEQRARWSSDVDRGRLPALREELGLSDQEARWLVHVRGERSLDALSRDPAIGHPGEFLGLMYILHVLGLVAWVADVTEAPIDRNIAARLDRERIEARLKLAREADYFTLLGVSRHSTSLDVRRAYADLAPTFAESVIEDEIRESLGPQLAELRIALQEARDILNDDALRLAYLAHLEDA